MDLFKEQIKKIDHHKQNLPDPFHAEKLREAIQELETDIENTQQDISDAEHEIGKTKTEMEEQDIDSES